LVIRAAIEVAFGSLRSPIDSAFGRHTRRSEMAARKGIFSLGRVPALTRSVIVAAGLVLGACGKDTTGPTVIDPPTHGPDPVPTTSGIQLQNHSQFTVVDVFISSCSASTWGDDRYDGALGPGETTTFDEVDPGCWDIKVIFSGDLEAQFRNQTVSSGQVTVVQVTN
jgi:hypothetical protein